MTPWGILLLLGIIAALVTDPDRYLPWLLSLSLALPKTAALVAGPFPLGGFQLVSLACAPLLAYRLATLGLPDRLRSASTWTLLGLLFWATVVTALAPTLFQGVTVYTSQVANSQGYVVEASLTYTSSNLAQVGYLALVLVVVLYLSTLPRISPLVLSLGLGLGMALSLWRLGADRLGVPFPTQLVDRSTYLFVDLTTDGTYRLRGVFTEPSVLALYALAALALAVLVLVSASRATTAARWGAIALAVASAVNLVFSRSGTGVVAGGLLVLAAFPALVSGAARSGRSLLPVSALICWLVATGLVLHERIAEYAGGIVGTKVGSTSYGARTESDLEALRLMVETYGLGAGMGSTRSSSLWPYLLASIGPVGALMFAAVAVIALRRAWRQPAWHASAAVLAAALVAKSVAGSAPSEPILVMALAVCLAGPLTTGRTVQEPPDVAPIDPLDAPPPSLVRTSS